MKRKGKQMTLTENESKRLFQKALEALLPELSGRWALEAAKRFLAGEYNVIFDIPPEPDDFEYSSVCWGWLRLGQWVKLPLSPDRCVASFGNGENTAFPVGLTFWIDGAPETEWAVGEFGEIAYDDEDTIVIDGEDL